MIELTIPGECVPKGRPRFTRTGRAYTPAKTKNYEALVKHYAYQLNIEPLKGALKVELIVYKAVPKSYSKIKRANCLKNKHLPQVKPDLDNYIKSVLDALNGVLFDDDNQICELVAKKLYGEEPKVELKIEKMEE